MKNVNLSEISEKEPIKKNIGLVTIWFERGQSYVTKAIRDALVTYHNTFIFARMGLVHGETKIEKNGIWNVPNLTTYSNYDIPHEVLLNWIRSNKIDIVIFNEEYDWSLVKLCKTEGVKTVTYLDYLKEDWIPQMNLYDAVICSTKRSYDIVKETCNAYYTGWGVDLDLFKPTEDKSKEYTFFHNAGWLGTNYRKMTPAAIIAFDAVSKIIPDISLLIHSQVPIEKLPRQVQYIINSNKKIEFFVKTLPAPGLYHKCKILLFPTKLEGLGLPLFEALSSGLPVISTNAAPMNEFIMDEFNGLLVRVAIEMNRVDNIIFPETIIDINDLALKMFTLANDKKKITKMSANARNYAISNLNYLDFADRIRQIDVFNNKNSI